MPIAKVVLRKYMADNFVETGTQHGVACGYAVKLGFRDVYSVELSPKFFKAAQAKFKGQPNVHLYNGRSQVELAKILPVLKGSTTFWLDAHYMGGPKPEHMTDPAARDKLYPLYAELDLILANPALNIRAILIDDKRCMTAQRWKLITVEGVLARFEATGRFNIAYENGLELNDIIVAVPK